MEYMTTRFIELCYVVIILSARGNARSHFSAERLTKLCRLDGLGDVPEFTKRLTRVVADNPSRGLTFRIRETSITVESAGQVEASDESVNEIFSHWRDSMGSDRLKLTPAREKAVRDALTTQGLTPSQCKDAITGCFMSDFHREKGYTDLTHCLREKNVPRFIKLARAAQSKRKPGQQGWAKQRMQQALKRNS